MQDAAHPTQQEVYLLALSQLLAFEQEDNEFYLHLFLTHQNPRVFSSLLIFYKEYIERSDINISLEDFLTRHTPEVIPGDETMPAYSDLRDQLIRKLQDDPLIDILQDHFYQTRVLASMPISDIDETVLSQQIKSLSPREARSVMAYIAAHVTEGSEGSAISVEAYNVLVSRLQNQEAIYQARDLEQQRPS